MYSHDIFSGLKESIYNSPLDRLSILLLNDDADLEVRAKVNKLIAGQFPGKDLTFLQSQHDDIIEENTKDELNYPLTKIKQFKETKNLSKNRVKLCISVLPLGWNS